VRGSGSDLLGIDNKQQEEVKRQKRVQEDQEAERQKRIEQEQEVDHGKRQQGGFTPIPSPFLSPWNPGPRYPNTQAPWATVPNLREEEEKELTKRKDEKELAKREEESKELQKRLKEQQEKENLGMSRFLVFQSLQI
jgi:hypothetical protein